MSIFFIREVPEQVYKSLDAVGEGENWWEVFVYILSFLYKTLVDIWSPEVLPIYSADLFLSLLQAVELQKLILAHNEIELLKDDIRNLPMLSVLNISHNKLSHLPAAIGE